MNTSSCSRCGGEAVRINGKTLAKSIAVSQGKKALSECQHRFEQIPEKDWMTVCWSCDRDVLRAECKAPTPFECNDGVMRSVADIEPGSKRFRPGHHDFYGLRFSQAALDGAIEMIPDFDPDTENVEKIGARIARNPDPATVLEFSENVCRWGGGQRVLGNLKKADQVRMADELLGWFRSAQTSPDDADDEAIGPGIAIKGLGVSFASKHLRMLDPLRFAVLDLILSEEFGFALNPRGYRLFMRCLREFSETIGFSGSVAELEQGIFFLVRQRHRSR